MYRATQSITLPLNDLPRTVQFRWPQLGISVYAELLGDLNRELVDALVSALPLTSIQSHAIVAGEQIYFPTRFQLADPAQAFSEPMDAQPPGRINFEPYFQYISLNYGPMTEPVPAWPLAQVVDADLPQLAGLGRQVWDRFLAGRQHLIVEVVAGLASGPEAAGDEHMDKMPEQVRIHAGPTELPDQMPWQDLLAHIQTETSAIWINEPQDVQALRLGVQTSDAGVYGQYFSPWVMVSGLVRSLAIAELAALARMAQGADFSVSQLQRILHETLSVQLGVISYFGLPQLGATLTAVDQSVDQIEKRVDFCTFIDALLTYVNRYNLWLYQTFPWHLGAHFPKADPAIARQILALSSHSPYDHALRQATNREPTNTASQDTRNSTNKR